MGRRECCVTLLYTRQPFAWLHVTEQTLLRQGNRLRRKAQGLRRFTVLRCSTPYCNSLGTLHVVP